MGGGVNESNFRVLVLLEIILGVFWERKNDGRTDGGRHKTVIAWEIFADDCWDPWKRTIIKGVFGVRVVAGPSIVPSKCDELSSKGSFRLAANLLLRPATVTVHCSKNRKLSNYTQLPSPLQQLLQPAASVNEALPTYLHPPNYYWASKRRSFHFLNHSDPPNPNYSTWEPLSATNPCASNWKRDVGSFL